MSNSEGCRKILLKIGYLGAAYCGFQVQKNAPSIQETVQDAAERVFGKRYPLSGCSRTDSGVHALEYYCTVETDGDANNVPIEKIPDAMNSLLPEDIAVFHAEYKDSDFHVRYSVRSKEYKYVVWNSKYKNPYLKDRAYHYPKALDVCIMNTAAKAFIGRHDFSAFMASGSSCEDTVREIYSASVEREGDTVVFKVSGNGFLYNMVRIMMGTLIAVSEGKIDAYGIDDIIKNCDRSAAGMTVPACGLYLNKVNY